MNILFWGLKQNGVPKFRDVLHSGRMVKLESWNERDKCYEVKCTLKKRQDTHVDGRKKVESQKREL